MPRSAVWYFDFISPFAYLQFRQLDRLPADVSLTLRPVLFAGLLAHAGQLGPAEIPEKKRCTSLVTMWRARRIGAPFRPPPRHPFNPLALLRLAVALGPSREVVGEIFAHVWERGRDGEDPDGVAELAARLGLADPAAALAAPGPKAELRAATEAAAARGVFGVPSFVIEDQLFWGEDMFELMLDWLADPAVLDDPEMRRWAAVPPASERRR